MSTSGNLKPCPFCGCEPVSFTDVDENCYPETFVYCPNCAESYNGYGNVKLANWQSRPLEDAIQTALKAANGDAEYLALCIEFNVPHNEAMRGVETHRTRMKGGAA